MEEVLIKFCHLGKQVFGQIDDHSFINCRKVGRSWKICIDADNFVWTKITKKFPCEFGKNILHIAAMTGQTEKFIESFDEAEEKNPYDETGATPYHYASHYGHQLICQKYCFLLKDPNPRTVMMKDTRGAYNNNL